MQYPGETIQSQYAASPIMTALISGLNGVMDPSADIQLFYQKIFDPATASGIGLDIWGRIVGVNRTIRLVLDEDYFGFIDSAFFPSGWMPFDQGIFYQEGNESIGLYDLNDDAFRSLIFWKALANISSADTATMNTLINKLLAVPAIISDLGNMNIRMAFPEGLPVFQRAILEQKGFFAKGAGVGIDMVIYQAPVFSFAQDGISTSFFNEAPFYNNILYQVEAE